MAKLQVAVIGAGPAGIYATHYLKEKGVDVHCFEASNHVAGRTASYKKDGWLIEAGALACTPLNPHTQDMLRWGNTADELALVDVMRYGIWRKGQWNLLGMGPSEKQMQWLPETLRFRGIPAKMIPGLLKFVKAFQRDSAGLTKEKVLAGDFGAVAALDDISIRDYCVQNGGALIDDILVGPLIAQMTVGDSEYIAASHLFVLMAMNLSNLDNDGGMFANVRHGWSSIFEPVYNLDKECYSLNSPVDKIVIENNDVKGIRLADGTFVEAEHVLCTTTSGQAKKLFDEIPDNCRGMLDSVVYCETFSYAICDEKPFTPDKLSCGLIPKTKPRNLFNSVYNPTIGTPEKMPNGSGEILHVYTAPLHAEMLKKMDAEDRRRYVLGKARELFPAMPVKPALFTEDYIKEAISLSAPGQHGAVGEYLKRADEVRGLHFGCEYMYQQASSEGAMYCAHQASDRILDRL